jgi:hypothetical protein
MMKNKVFWFGLLLFGLSIIISIFLGVTHLIYNYQWENKYQYAWDLGVKQSTIIDKSQYINEFANKLSENKTDFVEHSVIFLKTPNNSFQKNLEALNTLCTRMKEIQGMDPTSFQYNTAIEQITRQEQDEAVEMIGCFRDCWFLEHCFYLYNPIPPVILITCIIMLLTGAMILVGWFAER